LDLSFLLIFLNRGLIIAYFNLTGKTPIKIVTNIIQWGALKIWEYKVYISVGTSLQPKEFDGLKDTVTLFISLVVVQLYLILGKEFWNACFKE
jgi:hypothetical protein